MKRTLVLRRETLTVLDDVQLSGVAGGVYTVVGLTCPLRQCLNDFTADQGTCRTGIGCPLTGAC